ncbi:hypothetical protein [Marilutibacter maris]|uniref:hypothetical protein n=1 Tax=Marilutibacter maris TaxID=1605891 RepID=UPI0011AE9183|nr:hypothetical protein [Lysobacter maris]
MNSLLVAAAIVLAAFLLAGFVKKAWMRIALSVFLYACSVASVTFGMGGLRVQIETSRAQGKPEAYIDGLAARSKQLQPARLEVIVFGFGLMVLGVSGWLQRSKSNKESEG